MVYHPIDLSHLKDTIYMQLGSKDLKLNGEIWIKQCYTHMLANIDISLQISMNTVLYRVNTL